MSSLNPGVLALVEMSPVEDLLLALLNDGRLPGVRVQTLIEDEQQFPAILIRRYGDWGGWGGDHRFLDAAQITVETFTSGTDADQDGALLQEAIRVLLYNARNEVVPRRGYLTKVELVASPTRHPDWATASGPVQFADLPRGVERYQSSYNLEIRKPFIKPFSN